MAVRKEHLAFTYLRHSRNVFQLTLLRIVRGVSSSDPMWEKSRPCTKKYMQIAHLK